MSTDTAPLYDAAEAIRLAELIVAGKMVGYDEQELIGALLSEIKRHEGRREAAPAQNPQSEHLRNMIRQQNEALSKPMLPRY